MNPDFYNFWGEYLESNIDFKYELDACLESLNKSMMLKNNQHIRKELCECLHSIGEQCLYGSFSNYLITNSCTEKSFTDYRDKHNIFSLLDEYPSLKKIFDSRIRGALKGITSSIAHFLENKDLILDYYKELNIDKVEIFPFLSDPHNGGLQVVRYQINEIHCFFYKPKSIQCDLYFLKLYDIIVSSIFNRKSIFSQEVILNNDELCFAFINQVKKARPKDLKDSFFDSGLMLYIAYITSTTDLIADNIILCSNGFYPVDIEFLHCPKIFNNKLSSYFELSQELLESSCVDTAMLPRWLFDGNLIKDVSGLCSHFFNSSIPRSCIDIDQFDLLKWTQNYENPTNIFRDMLVTLPDCFESLINGFSYAHNYFIKNKSYLRNKLRESLPSYSRFTFRPTMFYSSLLRSSFSPEYCINDAKRKDYIHTSLLSSSLKNSKLTALRSIFDDSYKAVIRDELNSLTQIDVPIFYYINDSQKLNCPNQKLHVSFPATYTYQFPYIGRLPSSATIRAQTNLIKISFALFLDALPFCSVTTNTESSPLDYFVHQLDKLILHDEIFKPKFCTLLQPINIQNVAQIGVAGPGLWNGLGGLLYCLKLLSSHDFMASRHINLFHENLSTSFYDNFQINDLDKYLGLFGIHTMSGINGLLLLNADNYTKPSQTKTINSTILSIYQKQLSSIDINTNDNKCIDLYNGLIGDLSFISLNLPNQEEAFDTTLFYVQLNKRIGSITSFLNRSCNFKHIDSISLISFLKELGLAHGLLGSVYAIDSLKDLQSDYFINQAFIIVEKVNLYWDLSSSVFNSKLSYSELQQVLSNCNGLGGFLLILSEFPQTNTRLSLLQNLINFFIISVSKLLDTEETYLYDLDYSLCCGLAGNYIVIQMLLNDPIFKFNSFSLRTQLESISKELKNIIFIRLISFNRMTRAIPHNLDLSLFKGYSGILLAYLMPFERLKNVTLLNFSNL